MKHESRSVKVVQSSAGVVMASKWILLCLVAAVAILTVDAFPIEEVLRPVQSRTFDYFSLVQQWPGTYCESSSACCQRLTEPVEFTIHGLWPDYDDGTWPECCEGPSWSEAEIEPLLEKLEKYWPTLSCSNTSLCSSNKKGSFWQHEWEKHGTCSSPVITDVYSYFAVTLDLQHKYSLSRILNKAGFIPDSSTKYTTSEILAAIQAYIGAKPSLSCSSGQIKEIQICLYKDFTPRDCGVLAASYRSGDMLESSSCPLEVLIPTFVPKGYASS